MANSSMDLMAWLRKQLQEAHPDLLRQMVSGFVQSLMSAEADALCGAEYGERNSDRVNSRNGYRERDWDTRVGSVELLPLVASRLPVGRPRRSPPPSPAPRAASPWSSAKGPIFIDIPRLAGP